MALVNSGRLSVQPVDQEAWSAIETMAEKGGWDEMNLDKRKAKPAKSDGGSKTASNGRKGKKKDEDVGGTDVEGSATTSTAGRKRKVSDQGAGNDPRRSTRARK